MAKNTPLAYRNNRICGFKFDLAQLHAQAGRRMRRGNSFSVIAAPESTVTAPDCNGCFGLVKMFDVDPDLTTRPAYVLKTRLQNSERNPDVMV
jgi:hypothetical protein